MHNTSQVDDEPYPTLLQDKGFGGFPSLAFMDHEGNVLTAQGERTVSGFNKMLVVVENYVTLKAKAEAGDESVTNELFLAELDLNKLDYDTARTRYSELKDLSDAQTAHIEGKLTAMEMQGLLASAQSLMNAGRWVEASTAYETITEKLPENAMAWFNLGYSLHAQGRLDEALVAHKKAAEMPGPAQTLAIYNTACAYALKGQKDKAFEWLKKTAEAGYKNTAQLDGDSDLDSLRDDPRYAEIIAMMKR